MWPEGRKPRPWPLGEVVGSHSDLQSHLPSSGFLLDCKHAQEHPTQRMRLCLLAFMLRGLVVAPGLFPLLTSRLCLCEVPCFEGASSVAGKQEDSPLV